MTDPRTLDIVAQTVYKALADKGEVDFVKVEDHTTKLLQIIQRCNDKFGVPFQTKPVGTPRGIKAVGDPCGICGAPLKASKKVGGDPWCYTCWAKKKGL